MQIYYTDPDPADCAANLPDQLTYSTLKEISQLMSKFLWDNGIEAPCKRIAQGVKFCEWIDESYENWCWLCVYGFCLNYEYRKAYDASDDCLSWKKIKQMSDVADSYESIFTRNAGYSDPPKIFAKGSFDDWQVKDIIQLGRDETHTAYQKYLNWKVNKWRKEGKNKRLYTWTNRPQPDFITLED